MFLLRRMCVFRVALHLRLLLRGMRVSCDVAYVFSVVVHACFLLVHVVDAR